LAKKRIVKNYDALPADIVEQIKEKYPSGYAESLVTYTDQEGKRVSALPFETDDAYYLIRMTIIEAKRLAKDEEDYDDEAAGATARPEFADVEIEDQYDGGEEDDDDLHSGTGDEDDHIIVTRRRGDDEDIADDTEY
jgi:hypothetical protein